MKKEIYEAMTGEEQDIVDFIAFENETSKVYPFSVRFDDLTANMVKRIARLCNGHTDDTETVYAACEDILGLNTEKRDETETSTAINDSRIKKLMEENQQKIRNAWDTIISMLPREPRSFDTADDPGFWTNGDEILCPSEAEASMLYAFLDDMFREFGNYQLITGWYDPEEDARENEQDNCTGFNYIRLE